MVVQHADLWNMPGGDIDDAARRSAMLDRFCAEIGRDPASLSGVQPYEQVLDTGDLAHAPVPR